MNHTLLLSFMDQMMHWKAMTFVIGIGLIVGLLLGFLMRWRSLGIWFSMLTGIAGAWLYHAFFTGYHTYSPKHVTNEIIYSCVGAFILTVTVNLIFGSNKGRDRTFWRA